MTNSNVRFSSSSTRTAGVIVSIIALSFAIAGVAQAQQINIDVTKPASDKPFGGEKVGNNQHHTGRTHSPPFSQYKRAAQFRKSV